MICPHCQSQVADGIRFCGTCGKPHDCATRPSAPQPIAYTTPPQPVWRAAAPNALCATQPVRRIRNNEVLGPVPRAELHNPKGPLKVGDMTITIDGELVPVVDVMLGNQFSIYFEHHILLWKHPGVQLGFKSLKGAARRSLLACKSLSMRPRGLAISRSHAIPSARLWRCVSQPGQLVEVREHQFLFATSNVEYNFTFLQGAANILFSRTGSLSTSLPAGWRGYCVAAWLWQRL